MLPLLALAVAVSAPIQGGEYRRAAVTDDGQRLGVFLYLPPGGAPDDPVVVLLPDLGVSHEPFDIPHQGLARLLRARGLRVLTLDWRGTGASSHGLGSDGLEAFLLHDLPAAVGTVSPKAPLILVGWGYGGAVAYSAAAAGPLKPRIVGVVGLNAVVDADIPNALVERILARGRGGLDLSHDLAQLTSDGTESLFARLWTHGTPLDDRIAAQVLDQAMGDLTAAQATAMLGWIKTGQTQLGGPYPEMLSAIRAPVLAVIGPLDNWSHPEFAAGIVDRLPRRQVRLVRVSRLEGFGGDAGHLGLVTGPLARELAALIERFARDAAAAPSPSPDGGGAP